MIELRADLRRHFPGSEDAAFDGIMALEGQLFRNLAGRRTLRFVRDGKGYFAKLHFGVGWRELLKNLLMLRRPVFGADDERRAIERLGALGVATMTVAGYGERGRLPWQRQSFLITDELADTVSLEELCRPWPQAPPPAKLKRELIEKVANIARQLHNSGVNHRDFYICHFLLDQAALREPFTPERLALYLIDLHRVQIRARTPRRWVEKDVAALHFSSLGAGLTLRDRLRFVKVYRGLPLRESLQRDRRFWAAVESKARQLERKPCR